MKAEKLGILSAVMASVCCLGPVLLVLLGLGSLGFGALLGRFHWWFILVGIALLGVAWRSYLKEVGRCRTAHCEMARGKTTRNMLTLASVVVALFVGLNLYTYAGQRQIPHPLGAASAGGGLALVVIPVEGMTCFTCELTVESALRRLPGVKSADARVNEKAAYVNYDPTQTRPEDLIAAINKTGYRASAPKEKGETR